MCGIALYFHRKPTDEKTIKQMTDIIAHRGPDGEGHVNLLDGRLWLGHRRLAIIDLSPTGHQPMSFGNGRYWITYNGEVYNYLELREELKGLGHRFQSDSDTEVILAAYQQWGKECLNCFNGMWAFVIVDTATGEVFGARDRFGVKPFYYAIEEDRFGCASEIKQLRAAGFGTGRAERLEVAKFIAYGDVNKEGQTFFEGICQLLRGEAFTWNTGAGTSEIKAYRYYYPEANPQMLADGRLLEYQETFNYLLDDAIRLRLRSDVPVGTCLSGGLDSSAITLIKQEILTRQGGQHQQKTFTSCFDDPKYDEWEYAEVVIRQAGVDSYRVFPDMSELLDEWPKISWHQEEPVRSSSLFAQWHVMRLAHGEGIKVLLDGQGADEAMAGYHFYIPVYLASLLRSGALQSFRRAAAALSETGILTATEKRSRVWLKTLYYTLGLRVLRGLAGRSLLQKEFGSLPPPNIPSDFQNQQYADIFGSLQSLLRFEDRNSMAFSIEARTPFLDFRLVELFLKMPGEYKLCSGWTKPFLRQAMKGRMPDKVRLRVDKKGFVTPEADWALKSAVRIQSLLLSNDNTLELWIDKNKLRDGLLTSHISTSTIWRLLSVDFWMRSFKLK